ncbi:MAG: ABC transporter permease [Methanohalobium sp.]|uniref:ABC transporter permease n=1 Tax=Methanohalobium sp. TaxID=2837493 RepID=UPI00397D24D8
MSPLLPKMPLGDFVEDAVNWIDAAFGFILDGISGILNFLLGLFLDILLYLPNWLFIVLFIVAAYFLTRRNWKIAAIGGIGFFVLDNLQLWSASMQTLALVISSAVIAMTIGIPVGILSAKNDNVKSAIKPILDFMQTMPPFVYLIPAVIFFGLGNVPGLIATIVFAMPPGIRLTDLGIRQVPTELVEVADAFGSTPMQKLVKVQLPVALQTIMTGVNQVIMLSLSMVVIASMIGARGLGLQVLEGINKVDIGLGFEAGLGIVIIAIILDRLTQGLTPE